MDSYTDPLVSIVTVNYNQPQVTEELLKSLQKINYPNIEVFVVDNGSAKDCKSLISLYQDTTFISSPINLGFAGANNLAIRQSKGEFILLLNNDTEVEPDFLQPMVDLFKSIPKLGIVSPLIIYNESKLVQYAGAKAINLFTGRGRKIGNKKPVEDFINKSYPTELAHGAAMLFPKQLVKEIGYLHEDYFLYYEEHDWCEACKRSGYQVYFQGNSLIYHKESMSVGKDNPLKTYYLNRNRILFIDRNASGAQKTVAKLFYLFFAFPKNLVKHGLSGDLEHAKALIRALFWNFKRKFSKSSLLPAHIKTRQNECFKA